MVLIDVLDQYRVLTIHIIHLFVDGIQLVPMEEIPIQLWGLQTPYHNHHHATKIPFFDHRQDYTKLHTLSRYHVLTEEANLHHKLPHFHISLSKY